MSNSSVYVPISEAIATAESTMVGVTAQDELYFRQWVPTLILPDLGLSEEDIKVVVLYPTACNVPKPDDLKAIIDIELYDINECYLQHKYNAGVLRIVPDTRLAPTATNESQSLNDFIPVDVSSNAHSLYFGTNGDKVAYVVLRYWAHPTDDNGYPLIKMDELKAVVLGIRYWYDMKFETNANRIGASELRYKLEADRVRAGKKMLAVNNVNMNKIIKQVWMRAIPNFSITGF